MKFCTECGTQLQYETVKFCPNCGYNIGAMSSPSNSQSPQPPAVSITPPIENITNVTESVPLNSKTSSATPPSYSPSPMNENPPPTQVNSGVFSESKESVLPQENKQDSFKRFAIGFGRAAGKAAFSAGKFTAQRILPKLLELSRKQLEDVIEQASEEEDNGIENGVTGREFEEIVADIFQARKYRVVQRNFHTEEREIDMIAARGDNAVMVECKARKNPVQTAELDSYIALFRQLKNRKFDDAKLQKLIVVAPKGGITHDAKNKAYRLLGDSAEFWERDRFMQEYEKVKYER